MRNRITGAAAALIAGLFAVGCGNTSPTGGKLGGAAASGSSSGGNTTPANTTAGSANDKSATFTVKGPALTPSITQGEKKNIALTLDRGATFKDSVKLTAEAPKGLKVEFGHATVAAGDPAETSMTVEAAADAAIAEHVVKVTATPASGAATSLDVKVKVDAKK
jgi:uncharacterized membrane protein